MLFQGMFFIITPALICGAFAERMKFSTMVVFIDPVGHCSSIARSAIGCGVADLCLRLGPCQNICAGGALDFAGGTVVHISSGVSALVCRAGPRQTYRISDRADAAAQPDLHGTGGWPAVGRLVRLQRRHALAADGIAASAFTTTHFSAAAAPGLGLDRLDADR